MPKRRSGKQYRFAFTLGSGVLIGFGSLLSIF